MNLCECAEKGLSEMIVAMAGQGELADGDAARGVNVYLIGIT